MASKLSAKQEKFCNEYLIDLNATQAAIRAGYSGRTAHSIGIENLTKPLVQLRLSELRVDQQQRTQVTDDRVIQQFLEIADYRVEDIMDFDGEECIFKPMEQWSQAAKVAVSAVEQTTEFRENKNGTVVKTVKFKFKVDDRIRALDSLAKHLGLFSDFNVAIMTLKGYGLEIKRHPDGGFTLTGDMAYAPPADPPSD